MNESKQLKILRYPKTDNRSLQAWNAADEHILNFMQETDINQKDLAIYNDRFGFLTCYLNQYNPQIVITCESQEKSILMNLNSNNQDLNEQRLLNPLSHINSIHIGLIKIPKSLDLFRLFLYQLTQSLFDDGMVVCAFMTRHFSSQLITIANEYFEEVHQSKAWKKSRLLILKRKQTFKEISLMHTIVYNENKLQQYFGVFSANKIDYATQFLIENLIINPKENRILDLGCGNGVIAHAIRVKNKDCELHLLDDSFLAVESAKLNLSDQNTFFHYDDCLDEIDDNFFDLVVSNPPFHFEYETNIDVSIRLFHEVKRCLNQHGRFIIVASKHLNFSTHLTPIFRTTKILVENIKFECLECKK